MTGDELFGLEANKETHPKCPDCISCQGCSRNRCRQCQTGRQRQTGNLGPFLTHGEYLAWKEKARAKEGASLCGPCANKKGEAAQ